MTSYLGIAKAWQKNIYFKKVSYIAYNIVFIIHEMFVFYWFGGHGDV